MLRIIEEREWPCSSSELKCLRIRTAHEKILFQTPYYMLLLLQVQPNEKLNRRGVPAHVHVHVHDKNTVRALNNTPIHQLCRFGKIILISYPIYVRHVPAPPCLVNSTISTSRLPCKCLNFGPTQKSWLHGRNSLSVRCFFVVAASKA